MKRGPLHSFNALLIAYLLMILILSGLLTGTSYLLLLFLRFLLFFQRFFLVFLCQIQLLLRLYNIIGVPVCPCFQFCIQRRLCGGNLFIRLLNGCICCGNTCRRECI